MKAEKVKQKLSTEDIIKLCCFLQGDDTYLYDTQEHPIFCTSICHGGDSWKLYYYPETQMFHCYTCGESYDVFELVKRAKKCEFKEAFDFIINFFNIRQRKSSEDNEIELIDDWSIFQKIQDYTPDKKKEKEKIEAEPKPIQDNMLEYFYPLAAPVEWKKDNISSEVMFRYGIRVDSALHHVIIPHRNVKGELIGIRRRSFNPIEVAEGKKYMPVIIQGDVYRHSLGRNLFGLYENKHVIQNIKKAFVVESEKSVLQLATMFGIENCWAVATCGSSFSKEQMDMLLECGVDEVVIGYDREFEGGRGSQDTVEYEAKLLKIASPLIPYVNVSVIMDYDHLTNYKDSPTDRGKEIFEKLYHNRIHLSKTKEEQKIQLQSRKGKIYG